MKKLFTLMAAAFMAVGVNAQTTLFDFESGVGTYTLGGTCTLTTVKIYTNSTSVDCLKFNNSYTTSGVINANVITIEGDFQEGDVITIAGAFNNDDDTKLSAVDIFTGEEGEEASVLFTTSQFINGRLVNDDPVAETFTLTDNYSKLSFGRNGNTGTNVTTLTITRPADPTAITSVAVEGATSDSPVYNLQGQKVSKDTKGILIQDGKKFVNK